MEVVREHCTKRKNGTPEDEVWEPLLAALEQYLLVVFFLYCNIL